MKNIFFWLLLTMLAVSCQKNDTDLVFGETPNERMNEKLDSINKALIGAENGWKAFVGTGLKGGYGFYFAFDADQVVNMVGDLTNESASELAGSNYRVKQDNGATLIFDTYNYISMLNNPNPAEFNGTIREGLRSDLEYRFDRSSQDSMVFIGKRYNNELVLIKATKAEKDFFNSSAYLEKIKKTKKLFVDNLYPYFDVQFEGKTYQVAFSISTSLKNVEISSLLPDGSTGAAKGKFAFSPEGLEFLEGGISYLDFTLIGATWEGDKLMVIAKDGKKYEIKDNKKPLVPLFMLIGSKYKGFFSPNLNNLPGSSKDGLMILDRYHRSVVFGGTGYIFNYGYMRFEFDVVNKRLNFKGFASNNGGSSGWITTIVYNYELDPETGIYTFKLKDSASGGYTAKVMDLMHNFLLSSRVRIDYYTVGDALYGKMYGVDQPNVEMTFQLE